METTTNQEDKIQSEAQEKIDDQVITSKNQTKDGKLSQGSRDKSIKKDSTSKQAQDSPSISVSKASSVMKSDKSVSPTGSSLIKGKSPRSASKKSMKDD